MAFIIDQLKTHRLQMRESIEAKLPASKGRNPKSHQEGLEPEIRKRLIDETEIR